MVESKDLKDGEVMRESRLLIKPPEEVSPELGPACTQSHSLAPCPLLDNPVAAVTRWHRCRRETVVARTHSTVSRQLSSPCTAAATGKHRFFSNTVFPRRISRANRERCRGVVTGPSSCPQRIGCTLFDRTLGDRVRGAVLA